MFSRGLETTAVSGTVAVVEPRERRTKVSETGARTPPAPATTSSSRSPLVESGTRAPAVTSPVTVTAVLVGCTTVTITCGSIALPASSCSIWVCTSWTRLPATWMRPAYGTVMAPSRVTTWGGMVADFEPEENRSTDREPENRPPVLAS